jgi:hypothetical protein
MGAIRTACLGAIALLLLTSAAQAQPTDIDEHGRPSRLPLQANWWAAQAAAAPKPVTDKPAPSEKPKASKKRNGDTSSVQRRDRAGGAKPGG